MTKRAKYGMLGVAILAVTVAAVACFFLLGGGRYVSSLPADAQAVARLDVRALADTLPLSLTQEQQQEMECSGIDLRKPIYAFVDGQDRPGVLLPLASDGQFEACLQGKGIAVEHQRGYRWAQWGQCLLAFSDDRCLAFGPLSEQEMGPMRGTMVALLKQDGEPESVLLQRVEKSAAPLSAAFQVSLVQHLLTRFYPQVALVLQDEQEGTVSIEASLRGRDLMVDAVLHGTGLGGEKSFLVPLKAEGEAAACTDGSTMVSMGVDGERLLRTLRKVPAVRTALIAMNFCLDLDQIIRSVQGDVTLTLPEAGAEGMSPVLTASLSDTRFMQNSGEWNQGLSSAVDVRVNRMGDSTFCVQLPSNSIYFGVRNSHLVVARDESAYAWAHDRLGAAAPARPSQDGGRWLVYAQQDLGHLDRFSAFVRGAFGADGLAALSVWDGKLILRVSADEDKQQND